MPSWPVKFNGLLPDVLPFIGPAHQLAAGDIGEPMGQPTKDGIDELILSNTTGEVVTWALP